MEAELGEVHGVADWERSNGFYRNAPGAGVVPLGANRVAYAFGEQRLNVHRLGYFRDPDGSLLELISHRR